jgi:amino acid permease
VWFGKTVPVWVFGFLLFIIYSPLVWVRRVASFKKAFYLAFTIVILTVALTGWFMLDSIAQNDWQPAPGFVASIPTNFWTMLGGAFFTF